MNATLLSPHKETITNYMYLGLLPFFIGALGPWIFADNETVLSEAFLLYSTVIYAFLSGAIWATALFGHSEATRIFIGRHIHAAIVCSLVPFLSYALPLIYHAAVMLVAYLALLFWEKLFLQDIYPSWYQALRHRITFIAVACHMLVIWNLMLNT